jgi:two-component system LytT family response regulator
MDTVNGEYNCFIVDDNHIDRLTTLSFVRNQSFLKITGQFDRATMALEAAEKSMPDVVFLDIDMPEINGLNLRTQLDKVPACIFITAYPDYALSAFEVNALDFLVKPLKSDRFGISMNRLKEFLQIRQRADLIHHKIEDDNLFIKDGREHIKIKFKDIIYLEALKDYTGIVTQDRKYSVLSPIGNLLREKAFQNFIRIHRSYAVQKNKIQRFNSKEVMAGRTLLPIGRMYKDDLNTFLTS